MRSFVIKKPLMQPIHELSQPLATQATVSLIESGILSNEATTYLFDDAEEYNPYLLDLLSVMVANDLEELDLEYDEEDTIVGEVVDYVVEVVTTNSVELCDLLGLINDDTSVGLLSEHPSLYVMSLEEPEIPNT